jgi:hypothetical protein
VRRRRGAKQQESGGPSHNRQFQPIIVGTIVESTLNVTPAMEARIPDHVCIVEETKETKFSISIHFADGRNFCGAHWVKIVVCVIGEFLRAPMLLRIEFRLL